MSTNEELIDELCAELQQLCTELERVKKVSEENRSRGMIESRRRRYTDYNTDRRGDVKKQAS